MPKPKAKAKLRLSHAELAMVDALIVFAQEKGLVLDDDDDPPSGAEAAHNARNDGIFRLMDEYDRAVTTRIREIARNLDDASTLRQLIDLRGKAVRGS